MIKEQPKIANTSNNERDQVFSEVFAEDEVNAKVR